MSYLEFNPTSPLFHYTSVEAFRNIIGTGHFWLSDLAQSNDPRELEMPRERVLKAIKGFDRSQLPPETRNNTLIVTMDLVRSLANQRVYSLCLSQNRDSLHEWKEYALNGKGVAFGIRPRAIRDMYVRVQKVSYVDQYETDFFNNRVETEYERLRYVVASDLDLETRVEITSALLSTIYSTKHDSWTQEREVRLTFASSISDLGERHAIAEYPDGRLVNYSPPLSRQSGSGTIDYFSLPYGRYHDGIYDKTFALNEVILGPNCSSPRNEIECFLNEAGMMDVSIVHSDCAFNPR